MRYSEFLNVKIMSNNVWPLTQNYCP